MYRVLIFYFIFVFKKIAVIVVSCEIRDPLGWLVTTCRNAAQLTPAHKITLNMKQGPRFDQLIQII